MISYFFFHQWCHRWYGTSGERFFKCGFFGVPVGVDRPWFSALPGSSFFQPRLRISSSGMPPCCPCNANGVGIRCKKCVCAKSARACSNCAPGRSDPCQCQNHPLPVVSTPSLSLPLSYSAAATPPRPSSRSAPASPGRPETSEENPNTVVSVEQSTSTAIFQPQSRPAGTTPTSQPRCTGTPRTPSTTNTIGNRRRDLPEDFQDDTSQVESSDIPFPTAALGGAHPNDSSAAEVDIDAKLEEVYGEPILNESEQPRTDP